MFNPNNQHQPHPHEADSFSSTDSNQIQFYKSAGNILEFSAYFATGLTVAFLCRALSALVFYALMVIAVLIYLWIVQKDAQTHKQKATWAIALALSLSVSGAFWDAIYQLVGIIIALTNPLTWIGAGLFIVAFVGLCVTRRKP